MFVNKQRTLESDSMKSLSRRRVVCYKSRADICVSASQQGRLPPTADCQTSHTNTRSSCARSCPNRRRRRASILGGNIRPFASKTDGPTNLKELLSIQHSSLNLLRWESLESGQSLHYRIPMHASRPYPCSRIFFDALGLVFGVISSAFRRNWGFRYPLLHPHPQIGVVGQRKSRTKM